jgi:hypothetical protein
MGNGQDVRFLKLELQAPASGDDESELKIDAKKCTKNIGDLRIEIKSLDIRIISERKARKETSDKWFNSPDLLLYMSVSVLLGILLALSLHVIAYR